ncbi:hypothetical protein [Isachenkonia alkalipeptolytica]|uniref:Phosphatidic acid phosphatase type 2/haloperoxidase domain-containing protein n=1 Tax=Isachenkonia alkalipeptolytica TaxID=2565777 RepID=A0AA43XLH0_9CLOT|nr:hypothetical protein [Isachenkonia alkalipeptolytica]NBG88434.1 hypothetical protein [Isachenkonia alkalipeptolytica]
MKNKLALGISVITVVPMVALLTIMSIYLIDFSFYNKQEFWVIWSIVFLVIVPSSAYAIKYLVPKFRTKGRTWERNLAFVTGVTGQVLGFLGTLYLQAPQGVKALFMVYLVAGILLSVTNFIIGKKASGHACGVSGPITLITFVFGFKAGLVFLVMPLVFWSRLKLKRHDISELLLGTVIGITATIISFLHVG